MQPGRPILRPLNATSLVDESIYLYRSNFLLFFGISSVLVVPASMLAYLLGSIIATFIPLPDMGQAQGQMQTSISSGVSSVLVLLFVIPASLFSSAVLTYAVAERYLARNVTISSAFKAVIKLFWPLARTFAAIGLVAMAVYLGVMAALATVLAVALATQSTGAIVALVIGVAPFLVVLAVLWLAGLVWIAMLPSTCIIEKVWYFKAARRAWILARTRFWTILVVLILAGIIQSILTAPISLANELMASNLLLAGIYGLAYGLLAGFAEPIGRVPTVLLYFDARVRSEGFDLELLAQAMGQTQSSEQQAVAVPPT
ncbi:MAG: hypothetical protein IT209_00175 [Armatimonadetes bacterium]|nr:hypothetical protein [Armatimonadota bacterium]